MLHTLALFDKRTMCVYVRIFLDRCVKQHFRWCNTGQTVKLRFMPWFNAMTNFGAAILHRYDWFHIELTQLRVHLSTPMKHTKQLVASEAFR